MRIGVLRVQVDWTHEPNQERLDRVDPGPWAPLGRFRDEEVMDKEENMHAVRIPLMAPMTCFYVFESLNGISLFRRTQNIRTQKGEVGAPRRLKLHVSALQSLKETVTYQTQPRRGSVPT